MALSKQEQRRVIAIAEGRQLATSGAGRMLRQAAGLTLAEIAEAVGVDPSTVYHWEVGTKRPTGANAIAYRNLLEGLREVHAGKRRKAAAA